MTPLMEIVLAATPTDKQFAKTAGEIARPLGKGPHQIGSPLAQLRKLGMVKVTRRVPEGAKSRNIFIYGRWEEFIPQKKHWYIPLTAVEKFLRANEESLVVIGSVWANGTGRYELEDGRVFKWTKVQMRKHIEAGGKFEPEWKMRTE